MTSRNLSPQWLKFLKSLGIEFWLPLPILGISFWVVGGWLTQHSLTSPSKNMIELQTTQPDYDKKIAFIKVEIYPKKGISSVKIMRLSKVYKQSEIILATTHIPHLEATIGAELGLSPEQVRKKMRYRREN
ncbi:MAG: hypothetical protein ACFCUV_05860 [Rivularia sp. (in: cyanobacteria)]